MRELRKIKEPRGLIRPMRLRGPMRCMGLLGHIRPISLIGLISLYGLISCSHEEAIEPTPVPEDGTPIVFTAMQQEEQTVTRSDTEGNSLSAVTRSPLYDVTSIFQVYGYKNMGYAEGDPISYTDPQQVFPGYTVRWQENSANTTVTNTNGWEYVNQQNTGNDEQTIKYWDWSATAYRFFGTTGSMTFGTNETNGVVYEATLSIDADATSSDNINATPYFSRLWFSNGNTTTYPTRQFGLPVQLEFVKPYSKVRFMFVPADPDVELEDLNLTDPSFRPTPPSESSTDVQKLIATAGTFTVTYPLSGIKTVEEWAVSSVTGTLSVDGLTEYYTQETPHWYTVLPAKADDQGTYTLTISVNGETLECVVPKEFMEWLPGYEYTYIFKVDDVGGVELGQVTSAYTDWLRGEEKEHPIYNW